MKKTLSFLLGLSLLSSSSLNAQFVSVPFKDGFIGTVGSNGNQAKNISRYSTGVKEIEIITDSVKLIRGDYEITE